MSMDELKDKIGSYNKKKIRKLLLKDGKVEEEKFDNLEEDSQYEPLTQDSETLRDYMNKEEKKKEKKRRRFSNA